MNIQLKDRNVLVLGLGETGFSASRWLVRQGARLRVADSRPVPPNAARLAADLPAVALVAGAFTERLIDGIDLIVASPGVPLAEPVLRRAQARGIPVVGDVDLFARALEQRAPRGPLPILAISGSNGKSTVTSMVGKMCQAAGLATVVAGNIGLPVLDVLGGEAVPLADVYVLELSSFQLETTRDLNAAAATVLNVSEDHLDRYPDMERYAAAKARIFQGTGAQVLNRGDRYSQAMALPGRPVTTFGLDAPPGEGDWGLLESKGATWLARGADKLMHLEELPVPGLHNAANALAALALCRSIGLPLAPLLEALRGFTGLPHRVQWVADVDGVHFYDDSKGTNVGATQAALEGMTPPSSAQAGGPKVVLIAGGDGKGQDFSPLKDAVACHARAVVLIGRDGEKIGTAIDGSGIPTVHAGSMEEAVAAAFSQAWPGDAVLLSPACASFDMFRNYEHRAQVFVAAVEALRVGGSRGVGR